MGRVADPGLLSHIDERGAAQMVDVTEKAASDRIAVAAGSLRTSGHVVELISARGRAKGDALATARVAAIMAAKRTSDLIPLCHQLALTGVDVDFTVRETDVDITATVRSTDRTGVEMAAHRGERVGSDALRHDQGGGPGCADR
jgi:cyclic pyranopterin phosphate synthase